MADDDEWKKLPTEEKVQNKVWKARAEGYKECIKKFPTYDSSGSEFGRYLGLIKKFVIDTNELNRVQGLQATLIFVENASAAGKTCGEVLSGIISKCFNTKPRLREMGIDVCLMYVEIDKNELVQEEMMKGFENKQPKIVHACLDVLIKALSLFGSKVISVKPLIKQTIKLLDHRDKNVRDAAKALFIEIYCWIGPAIRAPLQSINAVVLKELEDEWEKVGPGAQAKQTRFMRSQQDLREKMEEKASQSAVTGGGDADVEESSEVDPYDLLEPVEILSKLPKTFYSQIEEKKWQERKMALECCEKLLNENPRLAPDDYADFVKALKKVLSKDTNIMLVTIAIKCIGTLAKGLRKKFQPYALVCLEGMFERFKEKKPLVVAALQEAVDNIYSTTNIQAISESVVEALGHKNPSIRSQVGLFLTRSLAKTKSAAVNKALMKLFVQPLCKNIDHSSPDVREAAFQAIGTMSKLVGENKLLPFLADLDKLKMDKINECAGKAEVSSKKSGSASAAPCKPVAKQPPPSENKAKPVSKARSGPPEKKGSSSEAKATKPKKKTKTSSKPASSSEGPPPESELSDDVADELVAKVISGEERTQILNNNWKERLAGLQSTAQKLKLLERSEIPCQAFVKLLTIKPGWKDNNFNCMIEKFKLLAFLATSGSFSRTSAGICVLPTVDKIADIKSGAVAKDALTAVSEATGLPWVAEQVIEHAMGQKNPKTQSVALSWLSESIVEFGISGLNVKMIIEKIKLALTATNPAVRTSALSLIGTLTLFIGEKVRMFFENEKTALLQQIDAEMQKVKGQSPPAPTRGIRQQSCVDVEEDEDKEEERSGGFNFDDMVTRVDIGGKMTDNLIGQINDKNWKLRKEGLESVVEILNEAKFISADLGDLPAALKARLSDSNKLLVTTTLNILVQLSTSLGPHSMKHISTFSSSIVNALADSKPQVRQAAIKCMDKWLENTKLSSWLEGDLLSSALSNPKQTFLRTELLNWLNEKLPSASKLTASAREGLEQCVPSIYSCCEDRSGEVRAKAQSFLPILMRHLSYEKLVRGTGKLGASSKSSIMTMLEKAREQMPPPPSKPVKSSVSSTTVTKQEVEPDQPPPPKQAQTSKEKRPTTKKEAKKQRAPSAQRKAKVEEDTTPMFISLPNGKEQRMKDEAKLKTIKWNFTVPREELITQLQQQLATCIGSTLLSEMFHADFQHHLKAISMLYQGLSSDWDSTVSCVDILLRWFTLRFYDKNTTVHIKSLEYVKALFDRLIENDYRMSDYEVSGFLPHLITKIGENKDNIRKVVHGIIKQVSLVYPASKEFNYIMDGIKSKNARQRSECLDEIGLFIEAHGVGVCQPTAAKALKEIATNISDRDKAVRSSALNTIVAAYNVSGDIVYKQVGRLNEKDMSMLEERIKRSGKFMEPSSRNLETQPVAAPPANPPKVMKETKSMPTNIAKHSASVDKSGSLGSMHDLPSSGGQVKMDDGPLIPDHIAKAVAQIPNIDIDHLLVPLPVPDFIRDHDQNTLLSSSTNASSSLDLVISQISSPQLDTSITAIHELYEVLKHKEKHALLKEKIDQLLTSSTTQVRTTSDRYLPLIVAADKTVNADSNVNESNFKSLCKSHFAFLLELFDYNFLASQASSYVLFDFLRAVLQLIINEQFKLLPYTSKLSQVLNMLILRMFDHCDPTSIMCAILKTLGDSMEGGSTAYADLTVRCLWKLGRMIPQFLSPQEVVGFTHKPLNVAPVLAELDRCWSAYPRAHSTQGKLNNEVPLRSMKTVLLIICKQPNVNVMDELHMIPNPESSEIVAIIQKTVGGSASKIPHRSLSDKKENIGSVTGVSLESKLSTIFKKIGDRQLTKQGLRDLHQFKLDYPYYDVEPQIDGLEVEFFRDYVKRGLKKIEDEKKSNGVNGPQKSSQPPSMISKRSHQEHWERLNKLRTTCGLEPLKKEDVQKTCGINSSSNSASFESNGKVLASNTNSLNQVDPPASYTGIKSSRSTSSVGSSSVRPAANSTSLLDLKRRLDEIKQNSARR